MQTSVKTEWNIFLNLCLQTKSSTRLEELFNLFFTIEEKEHLASRMQIIRALLDDKLSQREISNKKNVSISQITRGSNALKIINANLLKFIKESLPKEQNDNK